MLKSDDSENGIQLKNDSSLYTDHNITQNIESAHRLTNEEKNTNQQYSVTPTYYPTAIVAPNPAIKHKSQFQMHSKINIIPEGKKEELNTQFLSTLPGVLKMVEVCLGFIAFIFALCADRRSTTAAWTEHIAFETTLVVTGLLIGYVVFPHLTIADERTRQGLVVLELMFYGINTLFYFISIWLMVHLSASWLSDGRGAAIMTAILCVALCVLYALETLTKFKIWSGVENSDKKQSNNKPSQTHPIQQQQQNVNRQSPPNIPPPPTSTISNATQPQSPPLQQTPTHTSIELSREHSDV